MLKQLSYILVLLSLSFFLIDCSNSNEPETVKNLLANSDMESGRYGFAIEWVKSTQPTNYLMVWDTTTYVSPNHSLKIYSDDSNSPAAYWIQSVDANVPIGKNLTLTVMLKIDNIEGSGVNIGAAGWDENGHTVSYSSNNINERITGTHDWQEYKLEVAPFTNEVTSFGVVLRLNDHSTGTVYFDDVKLEY